MLALYDPSVPFSLLALIIFNISNLIIEVTVNLLQTHGPCLSIAVDLFQYTLRIWDYSCTINLGNLERRDTIAGESKWQVLCALSAFLLI